MPKLLNKAQREELMRSTVGSELLKRFDDQHSLVVAHKASHAYKTKADMGEGLKDTRKKTLQEIQEFLSKVRAGELVSADTNIDEAIIAGGLAIEVRNRIRIRSE